MATPDYLLFVDESGQKEFSPSGVYDQTGVPSRYFVFGSLLLTQAGASQLDEQVRALKIGTFGNAQVEVKSNWLRIPRERESRYTQKFGASEERLRDFVLAFEGVILGCEGLLIASVVDKYRQSLCYPGREHYAPATAYDLLLQRVQMEMDARHAVAHVTIDDMDGATPNMTQYKVNLQRQHVQLRTRGSRLQRGMKMDRVGNQRFTDSAHDNRIQAADLVAYNVFRHFRDHGDNWRGPEKPAPIYEKLDAMWPRFRCDPDGVVPGYGIVLLPARQ